QFLVCARGSVAVVVDDGTASEEVLLDSPSLGLYLPPILWAIQYKYSADALLLVFASDLYDPSDYIRDYEEFRALVAPATGADAERGRSKVSAERTMKLGLPREFCSVSQRY